MGLELCGPSCHPGSCFANAASLSQELSRQTLRQAGLRAYMHPSTNSLHVRLLQLKKVLSSIPEAPLNVECLMNDIDFRSSMTREKFEEMAGPILDLAKAPVARVGGCPHWCTQPASRSCRWTAVWEAARLQKLLY